MTHNSEKQKIQNNGLWRKKKIQSWYQASMAEKVKNFTSRGIRHFRLTVTAVVALVIVLTITSLAKISDGHDHDSCHAFRLDHLSIDDLRAGLVHHVEVRHRMDHSALPFRLGLFLYDENDHGDRGFGFGDASSPSFDDDENHQSDDPIYLDRPCRVALAAYLCHRGDRLVAEVSLDRVLAGICLLRRNYSGHTFLDLHGEDPVGYGRNQLDEN